MSKSAVNYKRTIRSLLIAFKALIEHLEQMGIWKDVVPQDATRANIRRIISRAEDVLKRRSKK